MTADSSSLEPEIVKGLMVSIRVLDFKVANADHWKQTQLNTINADFTIDQFDTAEFLH